MDSGDLKYDKEAPHSDFSDIRVHSPCCDDRDGNTMSRETEIINVDEMVGRLLIDGKVIAEYKVENCDNCQHIRTLDKLGYQYNVGGEPILWFCVECRK